MDYKVQQIKDTVQDNLSISIDDGEIVLLYTPDMRDTKEHFHITLSTEEAEKLRKFLTGN